LLASDAARQVELPGGCVCCVLGDELDRTVVDLVTRYPELEAIVLETTGVAEPLPIAWALARDHAVEKVRLAAVATVVDAANFRASRAKSVAVDAQVAYADVLLVTKAEVAGETETQAAIAEARQIAPRAMVRIATAEEHAAWLDDVLADPDVERDGDEHGHGHGHGDHPRDAHDHDAGFGHAHGIASVTVDVPQAVDIEELEDALAELPAGFVRVKGLVKTDAGWFVVHRVGLRVSSEPIDAPADGRARIVGLGGAVDRDALAACVERASAGSGA
jgi:G3E family GTPase